MNIQIEKKQLLRAGAVAVIGLCIALALIYVKPSTPAANTANAKASRAAARARAADTVALTEAQIQGAAITVRAAGPAAIEAVTTLPGAIGFNEDRTAHVVPRLAGVVETVHADLGQHVRKGDVLAAIASTALAEYRSNLLTAERRLALAHTTFDREQTLWRDRISAEQDFLQARQALQEAQIEATNARQKLAALGVGAGGGKAGTNAGAKGDAINRYQLRAPFDGTIVEKHVTIGESVKEDANVFTISDLSTVWADIAVPADQLEAVRVGARVSIRAAAFSNRASGTITYVGGLLGEQTRTAKARVVLTNPGAAWRPGLFVSIDIAAEPLRAAIAVLVAAIHTVEDKPTVFVRIKDGFAVRHLVLGKSDGKLTEVRQGMQAGERYALDNSFIVKAELGKSGAEHAH